MSKLQSFYDLWKLTEEEQAAFLGEDIGTEHLEIVVELDETSANQFYCKRYAPLTAFEYRLRPSDPVTFTIRMYSIDDRSVVLNWDPSKMAMPPYEAKEKLLAWLKRSNYFVNVEGLMSFCTLFGKYYDNSN